MRQPNIVFILSEQHNAQVMGCAGDPYVRTPNLDRLAAQGTRLGQCYCNSPLCVPSRASLMTGRLPQDNQVYNNQHTLHSDIPTMAHALNIAGYETILAGRMHFYGLDQYHGYEQRLVGDVTPTFQGQEVDDFVFGDLNGTMLQKRVGLDRSGPGNSTVFHFDRDVRDETVRFLQERTDSRPLFLTVGLFSAHPPFVCPRERYQYYYDLLPAPAPDTLSLEELHPAIQHWLTSRNITDVPADTLRRVRAAYYGMVEYIDQTVGAILDQVSKSLDPENTVVVYAADHGESLGIEHMYWKGTFYDTSARIPCIACWPGHFGQGQVVSGLTCLADLTATFLDLGSADTLPKLYGRSLVPVLEGRESIPADRSIISQLGTYPSNKDRPAAMIRKGQYKLVVYQGYDQPQLFDLDADPAECRDLAGDPQYASVIQALGQELAASWDGQAAETFCTDFLAQFKIIRTWSNTTKFPMPPHWAAPEHGNYLENDPQNPGDLSH